MNNPQLTKKEYFTALAMQGLAANPNLLNNSPKFLGELSEKIATETLKKLETSKCNKDEYRN
jgi:hypothetical protein